MLEVYPNIGKILAYLSRRKSMAVTPKAVCIISGGMDSALSAKIAKDEGYEIIAVHFNYGQRTETKELQCFRKITESLDAVESYEIDLDFFEQIGASALTDKNIDVPTGGLEEGIPVTYVPFRNGIFLSIAAAIAEKHGAQALFIGVVEEDSSGYPDCRESYIKEMQNAINLGTKDETNLTIEMPLVTLSKAQIVAESLKRNVPLEHTWSCYQNEDEACGVCDSCRLRLKGFKEAKEADPITYQ
jgi:7-cyano-7-deazaguanine synthase